MAAPNLISASVINGKTTAVNLSTTSSFTVLNNPASSNKCLKLNTLLAANTTASAVTITVSWNNGANLSGTSFNVVSSISIPANSTLNVIDKTSQIYLEENQSFGASASTGGAIIITCSYEDIS